jgi:CRP/FNR family transcriptional regulator, cyclic AMP receptor protein
MRRVFINHVIDQAVLLRDMPADDRAALAGGARLRRYRGGEYLWRAGDPEDGLHFVAEGMVQIGMMGPDGEGIVLQVVARGGCIGEPGIYAPERDRRTDGRAVGRTTIVAIPSDTVRAVLEASPAAMRVFARQVSGIARTLARRVALTAFHDARGRLARVLLDLADSHGVATARGRRIELPLSQRTLAGLVSVRRESVNRLVSAWEREGAVEFEDGFVTVLRPQLLHSALGVDASLP